MAMSSRAPYSLSSGSAFAQQAHLARHLLQYDLGYFDGETCRLEPIDNPFGSKGLPMIQ
jgi:hypothetical protein